MGSFKYFKTKYKRYKGKVDTLLNEKLKNVEWGEFSFDKLFQVCTVKNKLTKSDLDNNGEIAVYSSESINNGIVGYINDNPEFIVNENNPIYIVFGDHTISFNIATKSFCVMDNVKVLSINEIMSIGVLMFIISSWKRCIPNKGYSRHWSLAKNVLFNLPITKNGKIDFEFMESFISELEAYHILELEAYLAATGLKDYTLNDKEKEVLDTFEKGQITFNKFKIGDLFEINSSEKRFDANKVDISKIGHPYVVRTGLNNGIRGYINEDEHFLNEGNTISFGQDTATMFYQEKPYFTGDKIKIVKSKDNKFNKINAQFFIATMTKSFSSFSWGSSSFNVNIIANQLITLPKKAKQPDYEIMETFISAIQKLVIKDVLLYADKKITTTKSIVNK